jgi:hypothetical protein
MLGLVKAAGRGRTLRGIVRPLHQASFQDATIAPQLPGTWSRAGMSRPFGTEKPELK